MSGKFLNSKMLINFLVLFCYMLFLELAFRLLTNSVVIDDSLSRIITGYAIFALVVSFILSWVKQIAARVIICLIGFGLAIYAFLQIGFYNYMDIFMSVNVSGQMGAVTSYIGDFFSSFQAVHYLIFVPVVVLIGFYVVWGHNEKRLIRHHNDEQSDWSLQYFSLKKNRRVEYLTRVVGTVAILAVLSLGYCGALCLPLFQNTVQAVSNLDLFNDPNNPSMVVNEFGVLGFGALDVKSAILGPVAGDNISDNSSLSVDASETSETNEVAKNGDEQTDVIWRLVTEEEQDNSIKNLSNYLMRQSQHKDNKYTGLFEGKNLIVIMMESTSNIFINPEYFPNFYKLYSKGWAFENDYSPRNSCPTINNEFSGMTGLYTIDNNCTADLYKNNTYSTSIFNLFNNKGYQTLSMHDYTDKYYDRTTIHQNMGSGKYYGVNDLGIELINEDWPSDAEFVDAAMKVVESDDVQEPFMMWLTTVSAHSSYSEPSIEGDRNLALFDNTNYPLNLKRYLSKLKTQDEALGILLSRLDDLGILDNTVIALYGDHYPYHLDPESISYADGIDLSKYEVERVPFVIYNSELTPKKFQQYTSYINLTPTIANLFGLDYDSRLYMGQDLLSKNYTSLVTFVDGSWKNANYFYDANTSVLTNYGDDTQEPLDAVAVNTMIQDKRKASELIIKNNYFAKLDEKIAEKREELTDEEIEGMTETGNNVGFNALGFTFDALRQFARLITDEQESD